MNVIYLILCIVLSQVQAEKLKICFHFPKKQEINDFKQAELSPEKLFLMESNDEIYLPGNMSTSLVLDGVFRGNISATNVTISGFHNFTINVLPMVFTLNALKVRGDDFQMRGAISDLFDLHGDGKFEINMEQVSMAINDMAISWPPGCFKVNLALKLGQMKVNFGSFMDGDPLLKTVLNSVIGDVGPDAVDFYWPLIYDTLQPTIQKIIDKYFNKVGAENLSTLYSSNETVVQNEYVRRSLKLLSDLLNSKI